MTDPQLFLFFGLVHLRCPSLWDNLKAVSFETTRQQQFAGGFYIGKKWTTGINSCPS